MSEFNPTWASPPGNTIRDILSRSNRDFDWLLTALSITRDKGEKLLSGQLEMDPTIASALSDSLGASKRFWIERDRRYRESLREAEQRRREEEWIASIPVAALVSRKLIKPRLRGREKIEAVLEYFGTSSLTGWHEKFDNRLNQVAFRTSRSFDSDPYAVLSWLRHGEILAGSVETDSWNRKALKKKIQEFRKMTREPDPGVFLPKLQESLAKCGVVLVIAPTIAGCRASGATFFNRPDRAIMLMSFRHLTDDHFWFTFFHEAGHLLLHSKDRVFVECNSSPDEQEELEANNFAESTLIPKEFVDEMQAINPREPRKILKFAQKVGVSPGIVIGQLQHYGSLRHDHYNRYKVRYSWKSD